MTLWIDFNRTDKQGRFPVILRGSQAWETHPGDLIIVEDGDGTRCKAFVEEVRQGVVEAKAVAYLTLVPGTVEPASRTAEWLVDDLDHQIERDMYREVAG